MGDEVVWVRLSHKTYCVGVVQESTRLEVRVRGEGMCRECQGVECRGRAGVPTQEPSRPAFTFPHSPSPVGTGEGREWECEGFPGSGNGNGIPGWVSPGK